MTIRDARPEDAPGLAALLAELGYPDAVERISERAQASPAPTRSCSSPSEAVGSSLGLEQISRRYLREL